jgi:transposase InsO family protein
MCVHDGPEYAAEQTRGLFSAYRPYNSFRYNSRFNRTVRNEVLDLYLFRNLAEVREIVSQWRRQYNEDRPHAPLGGLPPLVYAQRKLENSTFELSS